MTTTSRINQDRYRPQPPPIAAPPVAFDPEPVVPIVEIRTAEPKRGRAKRARRPWAATAFMLFRDISLLAVSIGFLYLTYRTIEQRSTAPSPAPVVMHSATYATDVEHATPRATRPAPRRSEPQPSRQDRPRTRPLPPPIVQPDPPIVESDFPLGSAGADAAADPQPVEPPVEVAPPPILPDGVPQWANDSVFELLDNTTFIERKASEYAKNGVTSAGFQLAIASEVEHLRKSLTGKRLRIYCQVEDVTLAKPGKPALARISRVEHLGSDCLKSIYVNPLEVDLTAVHKGDYLQVEGVLEKPSRRAQQRADLKFAIRTESKQLSADYQVMLFVTTIESVTAERWKEIQQRRLK